MLLPWLTLFDFRGVFANFVETDKLDYKHKCKNFVILIPIFNDVKYLTNIDFLKKYGKKVVLCTTNLETPKFYEDLDKIAKRYNFKIIKCEFKKESKNPWKIYQKTLLAHDYVLGESLKSLNAEYILFLDADTTCKTDLSTLIGTMKAKNYDLASLKVIPSKKDSVAENLQYIEYHVAMKSRRIYPWLTSGAAMIGKRERLQEIMKDHSLFFNGGDIEIGKLANMQGLNVGHIPVTFYTDVPETLQKLFRQRFSWFCGAFRHSVINAHTNFFSPVYAVYFTIIIFFMLPWKIWELLFHWYAILPLFLFYVIVSLVSNWEIKNKYMFVFPLYALFQVIIMPICGIGRYVKTVFKTGNIGFIKKIYKKDYNPVKYVMNILFMLLIAITIFNLHFVERTLMLSNIDLFALIGISFESANPLDILYNSSKLFALLTMTFLLLFGSFKAHFYLKKVKIKKVFANFLNLF